MSDGVESSTEQAAQNASEALRGLCKDENKSLRGLYVMMCLEVAGFAMCLPVLSFFAIKELGLTPSQLGLVISCNAASQLIGSYACGRLSDSLGRRWLLLGSFAWSCMGIGATYFVYSFMQLLILRTVQGLSGGTTTLSQAYVLDSLSERERPAYLALFGATIGVAFLCGNVMGLGLVIAEFSRRAIFVCAACFCFLATLYGCATITESLDPQKRRPLFASQESVDATPRSPRTSDWEAVSPGLVCVWSTRFFVALGGAVLFSIYPFLVSDMFGWSDIHMGSIMAAFGFLFAVMQFAIYPLFGRHGRRGSATALLVASICGACGGLLMPLPTIITHLLSLVLLTMTGALVGPAIPVLVGLFAGSRHIGFANGVAQGCEKGAGIIGPFIGGVLYEKSLWLLFSFGVSCYLFCALGSGGIFFWPSPIEDEEESKPLL